MSGGGSTDYYKVGVDLMMGGNLLGGVHQLFDAFSRLHGAAKNWETQFANGVSNSERAVIGLKTALVAVGGVVAGMKIAQWGKDLADAAGHFQAIESRMRSAGWKEHGDDPYRNQDQLPPSLRLRPDDMKHHSHTVGDIAGARAAAFAISGKWKSLTPDDVMETIKESAFVFGDRGHAVEYAEELSKFKVIMQGQGFDGKELSSQVMAGIRALELKGAANNPKEFSLLLGGMAQSMMASGGTVKPHDYLMAMKHARTAGYGMTSDFFRFLIPTLSQEVGASTVGTSLRTLFQFGLGNRFDNAKIDRATQMGLIEEGTKFEKSGFGKKAVSGGIIGRGTLTTDPWEWVVQYLSPALTKKGFKLDDPDNKKEMTKAVEMVAGLIGDPTAADMIIKMLTQQRKVRKDAAMDVQSMGMDPAAVEAATNNYIVVMNSLGTSWKRLQTAIGIGGTKTVMDWAESFAQVISDMGTAAAKDPAMGKRIVETMMAVGVAVAAVSVVVVGALAAAIIGAPLLIGSAVIVFGVGIVTYFLTEIMSWPGRIKASIASFGASIMSAISSIFTMGFWKGQGMTGPGSAVGASPNGMAPSDAMSGNGGIMPQSHIAPPPPQTTVTNIKNTMQVDGQKIAEVVAQYISRGGEHASGGSNFDGTRSPAPVDHTVI
ncbi:MAG: hypothetical protein ABL901_02990 [Hyphomicrobiaceae bacterium]|nr:hypothetical protein [Hyphomicrobiaceae bacterium]